MSGSSNRNTAVRTAPLSRSLTGGHPSNDPLGFKSPSAVAGRKDWILIIAGV